VLEIQLTIATRILPAAGTCMQPLCAWDRWVRGARYSPKAGMEDTPATRHIPRGTGPPCGAHTALDGALIARTDAASCQPRSAPIGPGAAFLLQRHVDPPSREPPLCLGGTVLKGRGRGLLICRRRRVGRAARDAHSPRALSLGVGFAVAAGHSGGPH
jgi:hypothetical protein